MLSGRTEKFTVAVATNRDGATEIWRVTHEINKQDLSAKVSIDLQSNEKLVASRFFFWRKSNKHMTLPPDGTNLINNLKP